MNLNFDPATVQSVWKKIQLSTRNKIMGWTGLSESDSNYFAGFAMIVVPLLALLGFMIACWLAAAILLVIISLISKVCITVLVIGFLWFGVRKLIQKLQQ